MLQRGMRRVNVGFFITVTAILTFSYSFLKAETENKKEPNIRIKSDSYLRYAPRSSVSALPGEVEIFETASESSYEYKAF